MDLDTVDHRHIPPAKISWDHTFDIAVVGAGPGGLIAALAAREAGASVVLLEQNHDIGGRAILSGGGVYLGGGTALQRQCGINDSPEAVIADWTSSDHPLGRYNDREIVAAYATAGVDTFDFCPVTAFNGFLARRDIHYGWAVAATTFLTMLATAASIGAPGVMIAPLQAEFGWSTADISVALAVRLVLFGLIGRPATRCRCRCSAPPTRSPRWIGTCRRCRSCTCS